MSTINQFSTPNVSTAHDKYRPVYSKEVLKFTTEYMTCEGNPCFNSYLDVACEYGQSIFLLCEKFQQVTGVDVSKANIKEALSRRHNSDYSNIEFMVGDPHSLPIETSSVDLLTCAMAWHLPDPERFSAEAKRVLKPGGCLAIYGYGVHVEDNDRIKSAFKMFHDGLFQTECFAEENLHVLNNYQAVQLPFKKVKRVSKRLHLDIYWGCSNPPQCIIPTVRSIQTTLSCNV